MLRLSFNEQIKRRHWKHWKQSSPWNWQTLKKNEGDLDDDISVLEPEPLSPTEASRALTNFMTYDKSGAKE